MIGTCTAAAAAAIAVTFGEDEQQYRETEASPRGNGSRIGSTNLKSLDVLVTYLRVPFINEA